MTRAVRKAGSVIFKNPFLLYLLCFILHTMHFNKDSHDNPVQNGVPSKFCVKQRLQKPVYNLTQACAVKVIAAFNWVLLVVLVCKWSLHVEPHFFLSFFLNCIYWKTCQMKVLKWPLCFWWLNMLRVYICHSALSLISFIWLDCLLFPWVKGTENTPLQWACVHATCPFKHARWYSERCVCVCECERVCERTLWWVLLMLEVHSGFRDGYSDIKKLFASFFFSPFVRLTHRI